MITLTNSPGIVIPTAPLDLNYSPMEVVSLEGLPEDEWLEYRRLGLGGSDCAAVFDLSPFTTARDLWYDKTGIITAKKIENWVALKVGHLLEELVAEIFQEETGLIVVKAQTMYRHPLFPFMQADLDYYAVEKNGSLTPLECKTGNHLAKNKWQNGAPIYYELQGRHYLCVVNKWKCYFAGLFGNSQQDFIRTEISRDLNLEKQIIYQEKNFWESFVLAGKCPPLIDGNIALALKSLKSYLDLQPSISVTNKISSKFSKKLRKIMELQAKIEVLKKKEKELGKEIDQLLIPVMDAMDNNLQSICQFGETKYSISYDVSSREKFDKKKLKAQYPDIYSQFVSKSESKKINVARL